MKDRKLKGPCASCGTIAERHEHHLVARVDGGMSLPTVMLCPPCHGLVHGFKCPINHVQATRDGLARARAKGRFGGRPFKITADMLQKMQDVLGKPDRHVRKFCIDLGISRQTLYRHVRPDGRLRPSGKKLLRQLQKRSA